MSQLAILHVSPYSAAAWAYGGIPRVVDAQVRGLADRGHRVTVATTDVCDAGHRLPAPAGARGAWCEAGPVAGVELRVFPNLSNRCAFNFQLYLPRGLGRYLRRAAADFDLAHLHACRNVPGVLAARHLARAGVPYVLQPHGTAPRIERRRPAKLLFDLVAGHHVLRSAARLLAVSQAERRQLTALGIADAIVDEISNPLPLGDFDGVSSLPPPWQEAASPVVLYLGQITPRKRVDLVVDAFARLPYPAARLVVAGGTARTEAAVRRQVAALGLAQRTTFTGVLTGSDRLAALAAATVLVYPTEDEVFGLVPLEAVLCGTPAVVADGCGSAEVIRRTGGGVVIPPGQADGLAAAISEMIVERERWRDELPRAAARVRELCAPATVAAQLDTVYQRVVAETGRVRP